MIPASFPKDGLTGNLALAGIIGEISFEFLRASSILSTLYSSLLVIFSQTPFAMQPSVYKFEPSQEETSSFELVRWTFGCFFAVQYSMSIMANYSQFAAFLLFNTPDQS